MGPKAPQVLLPLADDPTSRLTCDPAPAVLPSTVLDLLPVLLPVLLPLMLLRLLPVLFLVLLVLDHRDPTALETVPGLSE